MQVVILAAGRGTRLPGEVSKILREANGKSLFRRTLEQAAEVSDRPIVVCQGSMLSALRAAATVPRMSGAKFSPLEHIQQGAALSLLTAAGRLKDSEPVMVMDCDTIFAKGVIRRFYTFAENAFAAGKQSAILTFIPADDSVRYSFVVVEEGVQYPHVTAVMEKVRISNVATCGVHAFATWAVARQAIFESVILGTKTNDEYYLAPIHNNIVGTTAMLIDATDFNHVGTTEELEAYEQAVSKA